MFKKRITKYILQNREKTQYYDEAEYENLVEKLCTSNIVHSFILHYFTSIKIVGIRMLIVPLSTSAVNLERIGKGWETDRKRKNDRKG